MAVGERAGDRLDRTPGELPIASAKLMVAMPRPVAELSGEMNRPNDWRTPIVTIRKAAAARVTAKALLVFALMGPVINSVTCKMQVRA